MTCFDSFPKDIATVQIGCRTYVFFVNKDNRLCYIDKDDREGLGDFVAHPIEIDSGMKIKSDSRQVAAVAWVPKDAAGNFKRGHWEIRVYCICNEDGQSYLQEVCLSSKDKENWYQGWMGSDRQKDEDDQRRYVDNGSSLSALGCGYENIRVFVSGRCENGRPKIEVHSYNVAKDGNWDVETIPEPIFSV
ncbi:hypothetical protein ACLX1H_005541 [Fusarium chlamydosporum]